MTNEKANTLFEAWREIHKKCEALTDDAELKHIKHKYISLKKIKKTINDCCFKHNCVFSISTEIGCDEFPVIHVTCELANSDQSVKFVNDFPLNVTNKTDNNKFGQSYRSLESYAIRSALTNIFNIAGEEEKEAPVDSPRNLIDEAKEKEETEFIGEVIAESIYINSTDEQKEFIRQFMIKNSLIKLEHMPHDLLFDFREGWRDA